VNFLLPKDFGMNDSGQTPVSQKKNGAAIKKIVQSEELFGSAREVIIIHGEFEYRLQRTKSGKLILTK
jgi:hemin uptake protein HemP